jgi:hypothetical protein
MIVVIVEMGFMEIYFLKQVWLSKVEGEDRSTVIYTSDKMLTPDRKEGGTCLPGRHGLWRY